ncbi:MAG: hypothetical protein FWD29_10140 [Micrococcales bacterium]|nr:hypothetical protein [Micrococcales bacterium]
MTVSPGWTAEEIRDFVFEYERQPFGTRKDWLASQGVSVGRLRRWRSVVFDGDPVRGLVPRTGGKSKTPAQRREIARRATDLEGEVEELRAQVQRLEEVNQVLGKAIGLLHKLSEPGPE